MATIENLQKKNMYLPAGGFVNEELGHGFGFTESHTVGWHLIPGFEGDIDKYGYTELPEDVWKKWYWHGFKVTGAFYHSYSTDDSYLDLTLLLWVNTFNYHPEHDLLPVEPYKFSQWSE